MARFKLPKEILFRDELRRGPALKIDFAWLLEEVHSSGLIVPSDPASKEASS